MADATRRVSVRLSLDDAARVKQELREVGETGQRSLARIQGGAERASRALDLLDVAVRGVQIAGLAAGLRAVVVAGDALTQSMGRLNTALGSVERAGEIYDRLYQDSLQTGVAVRESVDAFARFSADRAHRLHPIRKTEPRAGHLRQRSTSARDGTLRLVKGRKGRTTWRAAGTRRTAE
jgi:hypothetical protein